jgi:two-component system, OmpR family, sensor histidine kinase SenX3
VIVATGPTLAEMQIDQDVVVLIGVVAGCLVIGLLVVRWRTRKTLGRRIAQSALRLEESPPAKDDRSVEKNLRRLERAVDRAALRVTETSAAEARLVRTIEAIPQGVVIADEGGDVVYRNRVAAAFGSARHSEALVAAAIDDLLAAALEGVADRRSLDLFGPPRRSLVISGYPLDDERRTVGAVVVIDDLTERRRLEAVRRDFVANISHELKTPVGALGLLAETIADEEDPAVARRLAERMLYEATRVGRTIDDLLELSRIEAEEPHPPEAVPVNLIVAEAVERIRPAAEYRGTPIEVTEAARSFTILGDRRQLVSAVHNLLDNATKYSEPGSTVEVHSRLVGVNVEIAVRDHGMGIPARDLERIFERFYRVDRARSRETGGTGLGLAIVRHVASNHAGECRVESREGEGSRFTLSLPAGPGVSVQTPHQEAG